MAIPTTPKDASFKLAYSPAEAASATGLGLTTIYALMKDGRLKRVKIGRSTLIPRTSLDALVNGGPELDQPGVMAVGSGSTHRLR